ncbi:TIGR02281 family clan AA aspartic protease [Sphingomonas sp. HDW15A]|uniref:retropepsin-like aspartic protease family protein n=1 Tax=Sphingomonas sp. HDW15A TaxID=2714942 RepID=UPI00140CF74F|nr:TIGR02281 family clan AA aspartic protease [Sphingomonas sp. HDW15A]QIK97048.1 TIGR02281 family clan AA aspartic protease [Sphingomonas sp. HDW15A]
MMLRLYAIVIAVGLAAGLLLPGPSSQKLPEARPVRTISVAAPAQPAASAPIANGPWTTLQRQDNGHFFARAQVNGQSVDFLIDTGATAVALTESDARRLGIVLDPANYRVVGSGASGAVYGQFVTLDSVSLEGKRVEQVSGAVLKGSEVSLLGQSFLSRMGHIEISGDRMIIR